MKRRILFLLLILMPFSAAARQKALAVDYTKDNLIAGIMEGGWTRDSAAAARLGLKALGWKRVEFARNDRIVILIPDKFILPLRRFRIFAAGWLRSGKQSSPFVLLLYKGNPTLMFFPPEADGTYKEARSLTILAVPGRSTKQDILYLSQPGKPSRLYPYRRG